MKFLINLIKGVFVGIANVIPGVSGGTMAVSFGIYDKFISAITNIFKEFKKSVRYLFPIVLGMAMGVIGFTFIVPWLLENQPFITACAFTGLILGGIPMIVRSLKEGYARDVKKSKAINIILFLLLATIAAILPFLNGDSESGTLFTLNPGTIVLLFFIGVIAAATMVIPGVSGSLVLMVLGYYFGVITAVKDFITALKNFDIEAMFHYGCILAPFGIGCIIGIFFISKLIQWLFEHYSSATFSGILGLIVISPISIFCKVNEEYSLSGTGIVQIIIAILVLLICFGVTLYMGGLEVKEEE